jgi:hypothetical protein
MAYTPHSNGLYLAANAGALAGLGVVTYLTDATQGDYFAPAQQADAYAQAIDTAFFALIGAAPTAYEINACRECSERAWANRSPLQQNATVPGAYTGLANGVVALIVEGNTQVVSEGIDPNSGGGGGGTSVTGTGYWHSTAGALDAAAAHGTQAGQVPLTNAAASDAPFGFIDGVWVKRGTGAHGAVGHADSPFTPTAAEICVPFDTSGGAVTINSPLAQDGVSLPLDGQEFLMKPVVASATPAQLQANGAGVTVEDPSNACSFGATGTVPGQGGAVKWKFQATSKQWIGMSGF